MWQKKKNTTSLFLNACLQRRLLWQLHRGLCQPCPRHQGSGLRRRFQNDLHQGIRIRRDRAGRLLLRRRRIRLRQWVLGAQREGIYWCAEVIWRQRPCSDPAVRQDPQGGPMDLSLVQGFRRQFRRSHFSRQVLPVHHIR